MSVREGNWEGKSGETKRGDGQGKTSSCDEAKKRERGGKGGETHNGGELYRFDKGEYNLFYVLQIE